MKKIFTLLAIAIMALAASCSKVEPTEISGKENCSVQLTINGYRAGAVLIAKYKINDKDSYAAKEIPAAPSVTVPFHCLANASLTVQFECNAGAESASASTTLHPGNIKTLTMSLK